MLNIKEFNTGPASFIIAYHLFLLVALPIYFYMTSPVWGIWVAAVILLYATGMSITGGYHRYYAHRSFKAHWLVESFLLFFGSMAGQGSVLRWSYDHRIHHAFVDTDKDPYSINKGFWYAHWLWILEKPQPIDPKVVPDLMKNKWVMWQHNNYFSTLIGSNILMLLFVSWLCGDFWGAFFVATWLRLFALHHFTWFINSLAHTWGDKPFCQEQSAVNNYFLALLTFGEGYHNYHHVFANDYRNGIRWYHFDPTKWMIWFFNKVGLAYQLKTVDPVIINKRMVLERKNLLLDKIKLAWQEKKEEWTVQIDDLSERVLEQIHHFNQLKEQYHAMKPSMEPAILKEMRLELRQAKKRLREEWRAWTILSKNILQMAES